MNLNDRGLQKTGTATKRYLRKYFIKRMDLILVYTEGGINSALLKK